MTRAQASAALRDPARSCYSVDMVGSRLGRLLLLLSGLGLVGCGPEFSDSEADAGAGADQVPEDGLLYWFSADQGVVVDSGRVAKWTNRAGNGLDATQISEDSRPKLDELGDSRHPALRFDGENDFLGLPPLTATFERGVSIFSTARSEGTDVCMAMLEVSNGSEIDDISFDWAREDLLQYEVFDNTLKGQNGAFTPGEPRLLEAIQEPSGDVTLWMNGLANGVGSFALPVDAERNQNFVGRTLYQSCPTWAGEIGEILFYSRALDSTERRSVEAYLEKKWGF